VLIRNALATIGAKVQNALGGKPSSVAAATAANIRAAATEAARAAGSPPEPDHPETNSRERAA
jgi:hypothetical protein